MTTTTKDLAAQTREIYEEQAQAFDRARSRKLFEARWLTRFTNGLTPGGRVLDLGCGAGEPIAAWLIAEGFTLTGMDFAQPMLDIARARWPDGDWRQGDMRDLDQRAEYDGIVAWDSFFHLTPDEQRACLPRLARALRPGGSLLVTVGHSLGEVTGQVGSAVVYHASLSPAEYAALLEENEMQMVGFMAQDPDCAEHSVLLARRRAAVD
ncbi:MAG: class I SAM-dependent methyltransferase [Pelagimonas sp.]|jgi:2-polyprenyl-3-methyl-5-hydroxy-6-metoxy-1,4-benzoquinol methylase|nr:class I SAM-dependent methyltransferase [Pelagimonas sp.]